MKTKLIVALDVEDLRQAKSLVDRLTPCVKIFKVGSQLFTACGPDIVRLILKAGAEVFLDLKFHDIPNTVACAVGSAARLGVLMLTVHASGGQEMLWRAQKAAREASKRLKCRKPLILAVTVLTSQADKNVAGKVLALAKMAKESGVDGVVASVHECAALRKKFKRNFVIVTPGIRPQGAVLDDQKRAATPEAAIRAGSDFLVVGRPILEARDPLASAKGILKSMGGEL
ncbi:MAG: orotidine-5'-phosphate decarboxylase [Candidatus Omnitrophota bacterium]